MFKSNEFIEHDFNLPNHSNELSKAEDIIEKIKYNMRIMEIENNITDKEHTKTFEYIIRVLDFVGQLSTPAFGIENELERMYVLRYVHAPELGKKLWLDHYETIHYPYNKLKNRCFKLLDELDEFYFKKFKKLPPNYKP